jgi:NADH dehydrogenase [ubiquinone] 1 alpha subcomplex assembly factor 7
MPGTVRKDELTSVWCCIQTFQRFGDLAHAIDAVYMVEASPELRKAQKNLLCGEDAPMTESKSGYHSVCKYISLPIVWTEGIRSIPISEFPFPLDQSKVYLAGVLTIPDPEKMPLIVAHEFFDSLPIHAFESVEVAATEKSTSPASSSSAAVTTDNASLSTPPRRVKNEWRELNVSPTPPGSTHASLNTPRSQDHSTPPPDFQLTLSKQATRHALSLPSSSPRYRALKPHTGSVIEISPDASLYASDFATRIGGSATNPKSKPSGAALILDYGPGDGSIPTNSLRGIRQHRRVSPFAEPGLTDLSVDVDFGAIAEAAMRVSEGVEVHGPVEQAEFLERMGIRERAEMLVKSLKSKSGGVEKAGDVDRAWKRLVDRGPGGMGKIYKALALLPENEGKRRPVGFGGDVQA